MPSFIHLFVFSILFPPLFFDGLFERLVFVHPHLAHLFITFVLHHTGEQSLIMLSRQLCSLGLAMSMQALLGFQPHLALNGSGEMLILFSLGFAVA